MPYTLHPCDLEAGACLAFLACTRHPLYPVAPCTLSHPATCTLHPVPCLASLTAHLPQHVGRLLQSLAISRSPSRAVFP